MYIDPKVLKRRRSSSISDYDDQAEKKRKLEEEAQIECAGEPPAWAQNRPELCETIQWFTTWRGTFRTSSKFGITGVLIDGNTSCKYLDEEVIILGLSGGFSQDDEGNWTLKEDQTQRSSKSLRAMMVNYRTHSPVGVVIGDRNTVLKQRMPHRFNVMDFYIVTDMWHEKIGKFAGACARLQKLDLAKKSWWAEKGSPDPPIEPDFEMRPAAMRCGTCDVINRRIFKNGWICCNHECAEFWKLDGAEIENPEALKYDYNFMAYRVRWNLAEHLSLAQYPLIPPVPELTPENHRQLQYGNRANKGMVCPLCRKCVPRTHFMGWKCDVPQLVGREIPENDRGCPWTFMLQPSPMPFGTRLKKELEIYYNNPRHSYKFQFPDREDLTNSLPYRKFMFDLPGGGTVTQFLSNGEINAKMHGPDYLYHSLQAIDMGLRRHRLERHIVVGTSTNNFLQNFGVPYKFCVPNVSKPFSEAPPAILHAYGRLDWAFRQVTESSPASYKKPNEVLLIGYLEDQELKYHDDGNGSLGPTIATLCLGSSASMFIHMKHKYYYGISKLGIPADDDPVLEGCQNYAIRKELKEKYLAGEINFDQYYEERKRILKYRSTEPPNIFKLELFHGHIAVMNGANIQKYYEHRVASIKGLRFAVTARHVLPHPDLFEETMRMGDCELGPEYIYDGQ
ncbi:hypothetical protein N7456_002549 [Penicillium angulare]|uniref:Alpha-ketoglutarate-dependent dioxygenase AlkB-like domain-containing protein n=1 Tax=Penicillium angulare TaxID=116970 RepID=A0A9W9KPZ3_9EURO|nr:hypothetical protein N7456_002549 [Penicillium angulare]